MHEIRTLIKTCARSLRYLRTNEAARLASKFGSDKGIDGHGYALVYEEIFSSMRHKHINILEIGLLAHARQRKYGAGASFRDVPSLRMWRSYFSNANIFALDIADFSSVNIPGCKIFQGDQSSREDLLRLSAACPSGFDIIIDDGLHASYHQQVSFATLFPHINPGGIYVIEDLHYQPKEFERPDTPKTRNELKSIKLAEHSPSPAIIDSEWKSLAKCVGDVQFYDSLRTDKRHYLNDALAVIRPQPTI